MEEMPVPVPPGRWNEYAAAISEGFCPQCRRPFTSAIEGLSVVLARCDRDTCRCCWELDMLPVVPVIRWNGPGETAGSWWDIYVFRDDDLWQHGPAVAIAGSDPPFPDRPC